MKETVWYSAAEDHILVRVARNRVELGCQGISTVEFDGKEIQVPDWLSLFTWRVDSKNWKRHLKAGRLVKLGDL